MKDHNSRNGNDCDNHDPKCPDCNKHDPKCPDCNKHDPKCQDCKENIICSQSSVAECEARLFCQVTEKLGCEIKHARCLNELAHLIKLTNSFLEASAHKEKVLGDLVNQHKKEDGHL